MAGCIKHLNAVAVICIMRLSIFMGKGSYVFLSCVLHLLRLYMQGVGEGVHPHVGWVRKLWRRFSKVIFHVTHGRFNLHGINAVEDSGNIIWWR